MSPRFLTGFLVAVLLSLGGMLACNNGPEPAPPVTVVDRTPPQVASLTPAQGSTNVDYSTPIQVVFTERVKEPTINDTTVRLSVAGIQTEKTLSLSSDGLTLTIKPKTRPALPASFSVELSQDITDLAGNALVVPGTPWSFEVPDWYTFGGRLQAIGESDTLLKDSVLVLDKQGNPIVAWSEENTPGGRASIFVYQWDGEAFAPVGGALNATSTGSAFKPTLALDDEGLPVIAWQESDGINENIYVRRWTGSIWQTVGEGALSAVNDTSSPPVPTPARNPSIAIKGNAIYVAWDEMVDSEVSAVYVWRSISGGAFSGVGNTGGRLDAVPKKTRGSKPAIALDSHQLPVVAFQEQTLEQDSPTHIYVMRLQANDEWAFAVAPFHGDDVNGYVSGGLSALDGNTSAQDCSLAIDSKDTLYLSWTENSSPTHIQVFRSTGAQTWERVGTSLSIDDWSAAQARYSKIQVSPDGGVFVSWEEPRGSAEFILTHPFAAYWDGSSWVKLIKPRFNFGSRSPVYTSLAIDPSGRPVIAWCSRQNTTWDTRADSVRVWRHNN